MTQAPPGTVISGRCLQVRRWRRAQGVCPLVGEQAGLGTLALPLGALRAGLAFVQRMGLR